MATTLRRAEVSTRAQEGRVIAFVAHGIPAPKGSLKGYVRGGRAVIVNDNARTKPWAMCVAYAAAEAMPDGPAFVIGPVQVSLVFMLPRPLAQRRRDGSVRPSAGLYSSKKPDIDKLTRTVLDALTVAGVWLDDGQVARLNVEKVYSDVTGVSVAVEKVGPL